MALPVTTQVQIGEITVKEFSDLTISQSLFGHHHFRLSIPFDRLEGTGGSFLSKTHEELCGKKITISFGPSGPLAAVAGKVAKTSYDFAFQGIVTQIEVGNQGDLTGAFQVQGYSPTYLLDQAPVRRTFRKQKLADVFKKVLQPYSGSLQPLKAKPKSTTPITYLAQYDESNFDFLHRLAAQYGEWFYYDGTQLQLGKPEGKEIAFVSDGVRSSFSLNISLRHSAFVVSQYNLQQHKTFKATSDSQTVGWLAQNSLADFAMTASHDLFPNAMQLPPAVAVASQSEVDQVAARYKSQHATSLVSCSGWGENPDMQLGSVINATGPGLGSYSVKEESFGKYLLTSIVHTVDETGLYSNMFEAVPWSAEFPPLGPHRKGPVGNPELAEVIDLEDPLRMGRVRVRYYWPVAVPADAETDWLRVSTPYSGDGKGQLFTPELKSQVLVGYEQNRAEQPLILGNLFHPQNPQSAKYTNPSNRLKGLQTAGGNKVVMLDTKGAQNILISNSNKRETAVEISFKDNGSIHIRSHGPVTVTSPDITLEAGDKGEIKLHAKNITIDADENLKLLSGVKTEATTQDFNLFATNTATVEATVNAQLTGGEVIVTGDVTTSIKAPIVNIN
ncbi:MAG: hypothetical protein EOO56_07505 [Hymenobacter sp.]|nr:MAG: hypothetical protein EOO56_07505 [Hymenobacter sp.]